MVIKIMMAVPTLTRYDRLAQMLSTVADSTRKPDRILVVDNGGKLGREGMTGVAGRVGVPIDLYQHQENMGVAGSVNLAMRMLPDGWYFLHVNDDIEYAPECIRLLAEAAEQRDELAAMPPVRFYLPEHGVGSAFTTFLIPSRFKEVAGYFDEQFFPAYFEDNDLGRRMNMIGIERVVVKGAAYVHHTSSTMKVFNEEERAKHHDRFRKNEMRYIAKWGGRPEMETFDLPYEGKQGHHLGNIHLWHKDQL
jgi:GT2 family glycosyltransferase